MVPEGIIERIKRAAARALGGDPDVMMPPWAEEFALEMIQEIEGCGYVVVPKQVTDDMIDAGVAERKLQDGGAGHYSVSDIYAAMIKAATDHPT